MLDHRALKASSTTGRPRSLRVSRRWVVSSMAVGTTCRRKPCTHANRNRQPGHVWSNPYDEGFHQSRTCAIDVRRECYANNTRSSHITPEALALSRVFLLRFLSLVLGLVSCSTDGWLTLLVVDKRSPSPALSSPWVLSFRHAR